jgi:hypothetical protein
MAIMIMIIMMIIIIIIINITASSVRHLRHIESAGPGSVAVVGHLPGQLTALGHTQTACVQGSHQ